MSPPLPPPFLVRPLAHRGLHDRDAGRVENAPAAFAAAIEAGYGIELDVQLSADGQAVVFHDATLDRMTAESGPVAERSAAELGRIALAGTADRVPTLAATLAQVAGQVPLLVELKDQSGDLGPGDGRLEAAVARDLAGYTGPVACMSFNPEMIAALGACAPGIARGLTTDAFAPDAWTGVPSRRLQQLRGIDVAAAGAAFVSHDHRDLGAPRILALRLSGVAILSWTIRSGAEELSARRVAQNITFEGYRPAPRGDPAAAA